MKFQAVVACGALGVAALAVGGWQATSLMINGKVASTRVRMINGEAWVPVKDVASAQGLTVQKRPGGLELVAAGGANQVDGLRGKIGDTVFDGTWRLTVHGFEKVESYHIVSKTSTDYSITGGVANYDDGTFTPKPGYTLYVADCTVKNGTHEDQQYDWNPIDNKTAVADTSGSNHSWIVFDIPSPSFNSKPIVPGGAINFKICLAVAADAKPQDLIVTLKSLTQKKGPRRADCVACRSVAREGRECPAGLIPLDRFVGRLRTVRP